MRSHESFDQSVLLFLREGTGSGRHEDDEKKKPAHRATLPETRRRCKAEIKRASGGVSLTIEQSEQAIRARGRTHLAIDDRTRRHRSAVVTLVRRFLGPEHGTFERNTGKESFAPAIGIDPGCGRNTRL